MKRLDSFCNRRLSYSAVHQPTRFAVTLVDLVLFYNSISVRIRLYDYLSTVLLFQYLIISELADDARRLAVGSSEPISPSRFILQSGQVFHRWPSL